MSGGAATLDSIRSRLRTATAKEMEQYAGVSYSELLDVFPDDQALDNQALAAVLSANAGQGTPLGVSDFSSDGGVANFNGGLLNLFNTCAAGERDESPHSISMGQRHSRDGYRRSSCG